MLTEYTLNITAELSYAKKWAFQRNPRFYAFDEIGGDCTNFVSQCLYAGGAVMNYNGDTGWYYVSPADRAPAWTGVEYLYRFLIHNRSVGPFAHEIPVSNVYAGDVIQLGGEYYYHSLLVVNTQYGEPYLAAHSDDAFLRPLSSYHYARLRCLRVMGRKNT